MHSNQWHFMHCTDSDHVASVKMRVACYGDDQNIGYCGASCKLNRPHRFRGVLLDRMRTVNSQLRFELRFTSDALEPSLGTKALPIFSGLG